MSLRPCRFVFLCLLSSFLVADSCPSTIITGSRLARHERGTGGEIKDSSNWWRDTGSLVCSFAVHEEWSDEGGGHMD